MNPTRCLAANTWLAPAPVPAAHGLPPPAPIPSGLSAWPAGADEAASVVGATSGNAEVRLSPSDNVLTRVVVHPGLTAPVTAGSLHCPAPAGRSGGNVVPWAASVANARTGSAMLTPAQVVGLPAGKRDVNRHVAAPSAGEIRGQAPPRP